MDHLTILDRAIRLGKVALFSELETEMLGLAASIATLVTVEPGGALVDVDEPLDALYVVLEGRFEMRRAGRALFTVGPDETIGNWALFDPQPSMARAEAVEPSRLLRIDREDFYDLLADHPEMTRALFFALYKRVRTLLAPGLGDGAESPAAAPPR